MRSSRSTFVSHVTLAAAVLCALLAHAMVAPPDASAVIHTAIGGATRYETAAGISRASYPATASAVVIASGMAWADALGGSALAGAAGGPMLLSASNALSPATAAEVVRLRPATVYLLGGTGSLSARVEQQVASAAPTGTAVVRLGGANRYAVASRIASQVASIRGAAPDTVFVVSGTGFADALSCAAPAAARSWPILVADPARPAATASAVRVTGADRAIIVGGPASVSAATQSAIVSALGNVDNVLRIGGSDRYVVSAAVAEQMVSRATMNFGEPVLASGVVFGDALAGGPLAALRNSPLLLVAPDLVPDPIGDALFRHREEIRALAVLGGTGSVPSHVRTSAKHALRARAFSTTRAMGHVRAITALGPRAAGGTAERKATEYVAARLREYGYTVTSQPVYLPGGRTSRNIIAERPGTSGDVVVIGGHLDSKPPSPGGNDNASGVAVTLELAKCLADAQGMVPTIRFVGFAAEEISGPNPNDHHFGARQYVASLSAGERAKIKTMVAIDMVGYGSTFNIRNMRIAPMTTVASLQSWGRYTGQPLPFLKDFGRYGWSDHEAFEHVGIPVAWLEWRDDPDYHTRRDTASHVSPDRIRRTGRLMRGWLLDLEQKDLTALSKGTR